MVSPISSTTQVQPQATVQPSQTRQTARTPPPPAAPKDTVQISNAAKILQEANETQVQTVREAATGDLQATARLAREAAAQPSTK